MFSLGYMSFSGRPNFISCLVFVCSVFISQKSSWSHKVKCQWAMVSIYNRSSWMLLWARVLFVPSTDSISNARLTRSRIFWIFYFYLMNVSFIGTLPLCRFLSRTVRLQSNLFLFFVVSQNVQVSKSFLPVLL